MSATTYSAGLKFVSSNTKIPELSQACSKMLCNSRNCKYVLVESRFPHVRSSVSLVMSDFSHMVLGIKQFTRRPFSERKINFMQNTQLVEQNKDDQNWR